MSEIFSSVAKRLASSLDGQYGAGRLVFSWTGAEGRPKNVLQVSDRVGPVCNIRDLTKDPAQPTFMVISLGDIEGDGGEIFNDVDGEDVLQNTVESLIKRIPS